MAATDPIRSKKQVRALAKYYLRKGQFRNYTLVVLGIHTALRISDLLRLTWEDVFDFDIKDYRPVLALVEGKTGKFKNIFLNREALHALRLYAASLDGPRPGRFLFPNNRRNPAAISRIQAYRIIRAAADALRIQGRISCHSLRKTFGYHAWKSGAPVPVIMDIYNHSSPAVTRRYLGVDQDDRDRVYRAMSFAMPAI